MSQPTELETDFTPRHGYQGNRGEPPVERKAPLGLAITISREAGARGGTIAKLVAEKLAWQVFDQELLEYMSQNPVIRQNTIEGLTPACAEWHQRHLEELQQHYGLREKSEVRPLAEIMLALAAEGRVVLIGRGAGCILPRETTLNVRIVAPLEDRIAYMSQWLRLSRSEAAELVRQRDERRAEFVTSHFRRPPGEVYQYDIVLNSSTLGEDGCADLIVNAAHLREWVS